MKRLATASAALALLSAQAFAQGYEDTPTSSWFKSLSSATFPNCCDQADCKRAESEWRRDAVQRQPDVDELATSAGHYWAKSNQTGEWLEIPPEKLTRDTAGNLVTSIFNDAILCERELSVGTRSQGRGAVVFCFTPKPEGA